MAHVIVSEGLHDQAYCDRHVLGFDEAHLPRRRAGRRVLQVLPAGRERRRAEDAGMGRAEITGIPAETIRRLRDRVRDHQARRAADAATRPAARPSASSSIAPPTRSPRSPAMSASSAATPASATAPPAAAASRACRPAPTRSTRRVVLAAAGRPAGAGQGGRLSRRHQDDLFVVRRSLQPVPERQQDGAVAGRRGVHRRAGPFPDADRALRRHRAAGHHLLGTQRRAHAVGRRRALRDLHAAGDPADVRVPQRHRHLRRPRRSASASTTTTTRPRSSGCAS